MRRSDREVTDFGELVTIMERCDVCRVAFHDEEYPYIVPLNFGLRAEGTEVTLYFHSALEGKKLRLLERDCRVAFEMDCGHRLALSEEKGMCTMGYESVMGRGTLTLLPEEEKYEALRLLVEHYRPEGFAFDKAAIPRTAVMKLNVTELTGKRRIVKNA